MPTHKDNRNKTWDTFEEAERAVLEEFVWRCENSPCVVMEQSWHAYATRFSLESYL